MKERLHSMFATASDLIGADDITDVLARITDRAAVEIRAPKYLLAIRTEPDGPILCHHRGIDGRGGRRLRRDGAGQSPGRAARLLAGGARPLQPPRLRPAARPL